MFFIRLTIPSTTVHNTMAIYTTLHNRVFLQNQYCNIGVRREQP